MITQLLLSRTIDIQHSASHLNAHTHYAAVEAAVTPSITASKIVGMYTPIAHGVRHTAVRQ